MRKVKLQMQMSIDGFVGRPNGELDWMVWNWDQPLRDYVGELTDPVDLIILGRKLAEGFIPYWAEAVNDKSNPDFAGAKKLNETPKIVFSKTLATSTWENTKLANGNIIDEISALKKQPGKDIIAYGGANFVSNLVNNGLIDEYHIFINPAAIGDGLSIFKSVDQKLNLKLIRSTPFECGIVALLYKP